MSKENSTGKIKRLFRSRYTIPALVGIVIIVVAATVAELFILYPPTGVKNTYSVNIIDPPNSCVDHSLNFQPTPIKVVIGVNSTVVWTNSDSCIHNAHADLGSFYSGIMKPGSSFTFTFSSSSTVTYHCDFHSWMRGTINILTQNG